MTVEIHAIRNDRQRLAFPDDDAHVILLSVCQRCDREQRYEDGCFQLIGFNEKGPTASDATGHV
jgi:hypothetical protein